MDRFKPDAQLTVAFLGTFDVRNYGDLLFPLIAKRRLEKHGIVVDAFSPAGVSTGWENAVVPKPMSDLIGTIANYDAIVIGGGNIVHLSPGNIPDYRDDMNRWAYPSLWFGATVLASLEHVPVLWNAPGVPQKFSDNQCVRGVSAVFKEAAYLSVRDQHSLDFLPTDAKGKAVVVPDTAIDLAMVWEKAELSEAFNSLLARKFIEGERKFISVHVKSRSLVSETAESLAEKICAASISVSKTPILIAIGQCHDDHICAREVSQFLKTPHILLDDPVGLKEIAAAISHSEQYVGCSLHGYITAAAYNVSGQIVSVPSLAKHRGFCRSVEREEDVATDWKSALENLAARDAHGSRLALPRAVYDAADKHWASIVGSIKTKNSLPPENFLSSYASLDKLVICNAFMRGGWSSLLQFVPGKI